MKKKQFAKKLVLTKVTVSSLEDNHLRAIKGGLPNTSEGPGNPCLTQCNTGFCCFIF